jgi:uracil-DNA glycosylase
MIKTVPDFIPGHIGHPDFLIIGLSPSSNTKPFKNGTFARLLTWTTHVGLKQWDFCNIINEVNSVDTKLVNVEELKKKCENRKKIIALGGVVSKVLDKYNIPHYKIDHPSPRNRNLNNKEYEAKMLESLKDYLDA